MLVLSRKKNESIVINDNIAIVIVDIHSDKVRIGINAPSDVTVHRKEVYDAIRRQTSIHVTPKVSESKPSTTTTLPIATVPLDPVKTRPKTKPIAKKVIKKTIPEPVPGLGTRD